MKKAIVILLIAVLALSLFACGSSQNTATESNYAVETVNTKDIRVLFDDAVSYVERNMDTSGMTSSVQDDDGGAHLYKYWGYDDFVGNDEFPMDILLDGNTITVGTTTVSDLKAMGFDVEVGAETLQPEEVTSVSIKKDGKSLNFSTDMNTTSAVKSADEMVLSTFYASMDDSTIPFDYKGLTPDSTLKDVIAAFGTTKYRANVSADSDSTQVEVVYINQIEDGDIVTTQTLMISMLYEADTDSAKVTNIQLETNKDQKTADQSTE